MISLSVKISDLSPSSFLSEVNCLVWIQQAIWLNHPPTGLFIRNPASVSPAALASFVPYSVCYHLWVIVTEQKIPCGWRSQPQYRHAHWACVMELPIYSMQSFVQTIQNEWDDSETGGIFSLKKASQARHQLHPKQCSIPWENWRVR